MGTTTLRLSASAAAARLGVSVKALRLYERHGLVAPERTPAGYRVYGPEDLARAADIVALRALGLSLAQVSSVLGGDARSLDDALAAHEAALDLGIQDLVHKLDRARAIRADLARGRMPADGELTQLLDDRGAGVAFDLPWPWGGEWFEFGSPKCWLILKASPATSRTWSAVMWCRRAGAADDQPGRLLRPAEVLP